MKNKSLPSRAWVEVNLDNLEHNIREIQKNILPKTKILAVVKANAYGHGSVRVAKKLNELGIRDFAVATLEEGVLLRKNKVKGNILILGYTSPESIKDVIKYDLMQTIVSFTYFKELESLSLPKKLKVQIKINTGMNRLGIDYQNISQVEEIYACSNLVVYGIYTHLSSSDSKKRDDILYTTSQFDKFNSLIKALSEKKINPSFVHLQNSYGALNYNEMVYDYVRIGIIMYGVHGEENSFHKFPIDLKPLLSLKARVICVREISRGECVSYERTYKAKNKEKIATVSIGYADGYPRSLSNKNVKVLIHNHYAKVIGKICMDQLIIDVTAIKNVKEGDIVTLIGEEKEISATKVASKAGTITYELLSNLGSRLNYIYIDSKS